MNAVIEWLDSTEGQEWSRATFCPVTERALRCPSTYSLPPGQLPVLGPLDPAHDPCGAPPLAPERAP